MKQIKAFQTLLRRLRNAEHFDFFDITSKHLEGVTFTSPVLIELRNKFLQDFAREDTIYKRFLRQSDTKTVVEAHEKRRRSQMAFKRLVEMFHYSDTPAEVEAAELLMTVLANYADAYRAPMTETSAMITNMIQDLSAPKFAAAVTLLGAAAVIERLRQDNETFKELYYERAEGEQNEYEEGSLFEARNHVDLSFAALVNAINVLYQSNEIQRPKDTDLAATLEGVIHTINAYIRQYETIYSRRNAKYHPGGDTPAPAPGGDEPGDDTPQLVITSQGVIGTSSVFPGSGSQMTLTAADPTYLVALLPDVTDSVVKIYNPETEEVDSFPVDDYLYDADDTTPIGLVVNQAKAIDWFDKPFNGFPSSEATLVKDDQTLANLLDVRYPYTMRNE
ncbi:MAG: DUF6261 family protein [Tannerellaceae bacterium]|jgi:hypothetical protein|nr:DUF6261 family protein [Tannerellaceae bacterium]